MGIMIGHIDSDCFYVSAERVRFPFLRNQPVGVLGNQGACVIAKSYELKAKGVSTGMPIWDAAKLCPEALFVKRDFRWYEVLSRKMLDLLHHVSPRVEYYSIDEMFFDARELSKVFGLSLADATVALQSRVLHDVGIPASIGIAQSKTLAKLGSDSAKPFGCQVLFGDLKPFLQSQPVGEMCGIGKRSEAKLKAHGIETCLDFAEADRLFIRDLLTIKGEMLWWELHGEAVQPIQTKRPAHKHIARGGSIGKTSADPERLEGWVVRNTERLVEALNVNRYVCGQLSLTLQHKGGDCRSYRFNLGEETAEFEKLATVAKRLFDLVWLRGRDVSHMDLIAGHLNFDGLRQLGLFGITDQTVDRLKNAVNHKIGRFALRSGDTLTLPDVYDDKTNEYDICDVQGKMCF